MSLATNDWGLVILAAIGLSVFYLRKYIGKKAENLAQKEDLMIVWKDEEIPFVERNKYRTEARLSLERCAAEISKRFSELLVV